MLYKIEHGKDIFELNPELKAIGEYSKLTSRQMTYVAFVTDYGSPFRNLGTEEMKFQAALEAGYKLEKGTTRLDSNGRSLTAGKVGAVESAIQKYRTMQKDVDREAWISLKMIITQVTELNMKADKTVVELEKAIKFTKELPAIMEAKKKLEEILNIRAEDNSVLAQHDDETVREEELSTLDLLNEGINESTD